MEHKGTVRIETPRLILRQFTEADIEPAFRNWESDDRVTEFLRLPTAKSIQMSMLCLVNHDPTCSHFSVTFDSLIALAFHCFCLPNSQ